MNDHDLLRIIRRALEEDLPDITTDSIFEPEERGHARVMVKAPGVVAGLATVRLTLGVLDPEVEVELVATDGDDVTAGTIVATASATVRALLSGERTLLNILQRASGIATLTRAFVRAVEGTGAAVLDTRKTLPGLRALDKYAVTAGGGENHRLGLHDMFLVKDNHVDRAGGITEAIGKIRDSGIERPLMVEVRKLDELRVALGLEPDFILLDNMPPDLMREAVSLRDAHSGRKVLLEASGGITLETVRVVAGSGIDRISIGALTHSAPALDISMKIEAL
jgi:nicotinate-nucleotide pyrophosphorylase (carboxylating)